jgi:hypothetical protein
LSRATNIHRAWEGDNQDWWDWYVSLAENPNPVTSLSSAELPDIAPSSLEEVRAELASPYPLLDEDIERFRRDGYVRLCDVVSGPAALRLRAELVQLLERAFDVSLDGGVRRRFLSLELVWMENALVRAFVLSPRIAEICARLLGTPAVRLYHDNVLSKEPGCGRTPWHYDATHFPLDTRDVVTAWIPAQPIPASMGPLAFASPIETYRLVEALTFNTEDISYDRAIADTLHKEQIDVDARPFALGEVSFHHNLCLHTAEANRTLRSRVVLANTYFADGARVVSSPTLISGDWEKFMPGVGPGEVVATDSNPICWPNEERAR